MYKRQLEEVVALRAGGVLEFLDRTGIKEMQLAVAAPLVLASIDDLHGLADFGLEGTGVPFEYVSGDSLQLRATETRVKAREVAREYVLGEPDGLEQLGACLLYTSRCV